MTGGPTFLWLASLALLSLLAACSGILPNSVFFNGPGEQGYSAPDSATPIATLVRERNIRPPDQASPVPLLEQLRRELAKGDTDGSFAGITYDLSDGNRLPEHWLVQSPTRWGHRAADLPFYPFDCKGCERDVMLPACESDTDCADGSTCHAIWPARGLASTRRKVCFGHSDALLLPVHDLVASARRTVDIAALQPVPDRRFLAALRAGLNELAVNGRAVSVRLIVGQYPPDGADAAALLAALTGDLRTIPQAHLTVSVAAMRSCTTFDACDSFSWPHAKFIAIDGSEVMLGGHNLWSQDYLIDAPVHDLSMRLTGPAASSATHFADRLWQFVCANLGAKPAVGLATFPAAPEGAAPCPASLAPPAPARSPGGGLQVLAVGRMGAGITRAFANHSELARDLMFGAATKTIRLSQQDIGFTLGRSDPIFPDSTLERLIDFIEQRDGDVYIVLSNPGATGNSGSTYSNGVALATLARHLKNLVQKRIDARDPTERYEVRKGPDPINAMLCSHIHLAPLRFGPDASWPGRVPIANHAKLWMVDDRAFYIGSDNLYPVNLQEFGFILDDRQAAGQLLDAYWNPLWQWSSRAAVSGAGVDRCIFRELLN